jgi:hypothetical protein
MTSPIKDSKGHIIVAARPMYAKKGGGTTHNINEAATKAVYSQQPIPRPQYQKLLRQLTGRLTTELRRYGYKPAQIRAFATDLLDDYFTPQQIHPDTRPKRTTPHDPAVTDPLIGKVG